MSRRRTVNDAMDNIAGSMHKKKPYQGGADGNSKLATDIERLCRNADVASLSGAQIDHLGRVLQGMQAALWEESLARSGFKRRCPAGMKGHPGIKDFQRDEWVDHPSIMVSKEGDKRFISEPYELEEDGIKKLAALIDQGWHVRIKGAFSTHFPAHTMNVHVWKKKP